MLVSINDNDPSIDSSTKFLSSNDQLQMNLRHLLLPWSHWSANLKTSVNHLVGNKKPLRTEKVVTKLRWVDELGLVGITRMWWSILIKLFLKKLWKCLSNVYDSLNPIALRCMRPRISKGIMYLLLSICYF